MENLIMFINGEPVVSSRQVAEKFEKQHKHVLDAIENIKETIKAENLALIKWFCKTTYKAGTGKNYPEYLMNKDGFSLLAMGFTGEKAIQWKIKYIEAFNRAEKDLAEALKHPKPKQRWLPPQILRCKYFNSVPCMTLADLEFVTGFDHATALWSLKRYYIPYIMLTKETLRQYRYENNLHTCNSRLIILTQASVVSLLKKTGRYTAEIIERVRQYFHSAAEPIREKRKVVPELAIRQLYILRNTLQYMTNKEERNLAAKYIVDRLMEIDLLRPSDYPGENLYDTDINSVVGWNVDARIQNAHYMLDKGMQVTRQGLFDFQDQLLAEARASIK